VDDQQQTANALKAFLRPKPTILNMALFGETAKQWRDENPESDGNIRDFSTIEQLVILSNMESINTILIQQDLPQSTRLK
jgi:hypothetical protein